MKERTCYKSPGNPSYINLFRTSRPKTFQCTTTIETDIFDFHKLVVTVLKIFYKKQRPKIINYRSYKNLRATTFVKTNKRMLYYQNFNDTVLSIVDMHTPKKMKCIRSNNCNFMTKELRKAIMNSSKLRNMFLKTNRLKNLYISLLRKTKRSCFFGEGNFTIELYPAIKRFEKLLILSSGRSIFTKDLIF